MECKLTLTLYEVKVTVILVLFDILCSEAHQRGTINAFCPQNNWIQDFTNISTSCSPFPTPCCIFAWNVSVQGASFIFVYFLAEEEGISLTVCDFLKHFGLVNFPFYLSLCSNFYWLSINANCVRLTVQISSVRFCIVVNSFLFWNLQNLEYYILQWRLYIMPNLMQLVERNTCALSKQLLGEDLSQFITHNEHQETVAVDPHILH